MSVPHEKALSHMAFSMYAAFCKRALQYASRKRGSRDLKTPLFIGFFARPAATRSGQGGGRLRPLPLCPSRSVVG